MICDFRGKSSALRKHSGLVQITQAVLQTLQGTSLAKQDSLLGVEKGFVQGLGDTESSDLLTQLTQTISRERDRQNKDRYIIILTSGDVTKVIKQVKGKVKVLVYSLVLAAAAIHMTLQASHYLPVRELH